MLLFKCKIDMTSSSKTAFLQILHQEKRVSSYQKSYYIDEIRVEVAIYSCLEIRAYNDSMTIYFRGDNASKDFQTDDFPKHFKDHLLTAIRLYLNDIHYSTNLAIEENGDIYEFYS